MDILRALPANIVATNIYPFAVFVIKDRDHLIEAVDRYCGYELASDSRRRYPIGQWDVERVSDFSGVFNAARNRKLRDFNEDLSSWNVSNGTYFERMFYGCKLFNSDVSRWNVANATDLRSMFQGCSSFNSDVSGWNVANATNLRYFFLLQFF